MESAQISDCRRVCRVNFESEIMWTLDIDLDQQGKCAHLE
jgi:hypothetical protein